MQKLPLPAVAFFVVSLLLAGLYYAVRHQQKTDRRAAAAAARKAAQARDAWNIHEDAFLRFQYPKTWEVRRFEDPAGGERAWIVNRAGEQYVGIGAILLTEYLKDQETRSLREIVREEVSPKNRDHSRIRGSVATVALRGGRCMTYNVEGRKRAACGSSDPMTREKAPCVQATLFAHCRADGGHYFKISSRLSNYAEAGKPDETAKLNAGTYERLLRSIRFKKG